MITDDTNLRKAHQKAAIIAAAFITSLIIYALLAEFVLKDIFPENPASFYQQLRYILIAVAAVEVIAMVILRNLIISGKMKSVPESQTDSSETDENEFIRRLFSSFLITYALCESIAIYGLILFIIGKDSTELFAFLGVAFFLMMVHRPKYSDWESRLKDLRTQ